MPQIATGTTEGVLSSWSVAENSIIATRDVIATVETAKAVVDVEAETDGVILRLLVEPGAEVETGEAIALVAKAGETVDDVDGVLRELGVDTRPRTPSTIRPGEPEPVEQPDTGREMQGAPVGRIFASPLARRLAREAGLSVEQIQGTGPNGRIVRRDVERAQRDHAVAPVPPTQPAAAAAATAAGFTDVPHTKHRRHVAARLSESKATAPHFYLRATVPVDRLLALRAELNGDSDVRISVNDLVVKAVARAHVQVPELNVSWLADAVRSYSSVDVAVAVATDSGLVAPVLRSVEHMTITTVARSTRDLVERARTGRLQQQEIEGGSISVTNLGMYGVEEFAAIINPPQAAILAVGASRQEPVVIDGRVAVAEVMRLTLSVDHRPVDGVVAARWMAALVDLVQHPARILA